MATESNRPVENLIISLQERAKELNCLYEVEQALSEPDLPLDQAFLRVVEAIPPGWQYPDVCSARIEYAGRNISCADFRTTEWELCADIVVQDEAVGRIRVCYLEERPREDTGPFLKEEERLVSTIADRLGHSILYHQLHAMRRRWEDASRRAASETEAAWREPMRLLRRTDRALYLRIARKMVNHLGWMGIEGAHDLLHTTMGAQEDRKSHDHEANVPGPARPIDESPLLSGRSFDLASGALPDEEILTLIQNWIIEEKAAFFPKLLNNSRATVVDINEGLRRYCHLVADGAELGEANLDDLRVTLVRRFLTTQLAFLRIAKNVVEPCDFVKLLDDIILESSNHSRLGGKTAGLFLAEKALRRKAVEDPDLDRFKVPLSRYLPAEWIYEFIEHNDLEEVLQQKYRDIDQIRHEYPNIVQLFKNSPFPPEMVNALSRTLDDLGEVPIIVRSSSRLEDRLGSAFSGKYKSLFLANLGPKARRLEALLDAIAEVYASVFGPDPITYREEKGLLDFDEEMGILIQQVVGRRVGDYFLPAFAGVAFSHNELRWSARILREDGLIRMVPGLGTRAVDRVPDDYPILAVPNKPHLRVNTTVEEIIRYSPSKLEVINLRNGTLETLEVKDLLGRIGAEYPGFAQVFSVVKEDTLKRPVAVLSNTEKDTFVADFGGVFDSSNLISRMAKVLRTLEEGFESPVDIEFAFDGQDLYLLQCRPQSSGDDDAPAPIPADLPPNDIVFCAEKFVSNGMVPDITHIVFVDPEGYLRLDNKDDLLAVGQAVGELNKVLPKRQFILMGPGRWGSRGDLKLGVKISYSDINNTAMLIEMAHRTGSYVPDLSFGTHFFQDLVEARIRYLPLYPDEVENGLNRRFLMACPNLLGEMAPQFRALADVVRVIEVPAATRGRVLRVLMNADLNRAVGVLVDAKVSREIGRIPAQLQGESRTEDFWQWRLRMAERLAAEMDGERFGVAALYLIGSTKNANAGPSSDIDLVIHFKGDDAQRRDLLGWLDGWSLCLGEINYLRTGYTTGGLLDIHLITDEDIEKRTPFAAKIGAVTDPARQLPLGSSVGL
ncbi:MAG: hypothetical protein K8R59_08890 [Thermoanaerobaculales bacterium]|nr:hypothetical protein [Thermoanaerobaculales bacterium]